MYFKILKKSLKCKKSINFILLVFIMLATMFIAGSLNNMIVISGGVDAYFDKAGVDDYMLVTNASGSREAVSENDKQIEKFLSTNGNVASYTIDDILYASQNQFILEDGENIELSSTALLTSYSVKQQKFFDEDNKEITCMENGTIYLTRKDMEGNNLKIGDTILFKADNGFSMEFEIAGSMKDAFLGADMMGISRFIISENDMEQLLEKSEHPYGRLYSITCEDAEKFENEYNNQNFAVMFDGNKDLIKTTYVMDMVVAGIFLIASICLIVISVVILRFTIVFTVNEDYKEIGIMKAIGIKDSGIRKLYLTKYLIIAVVGAIIGFGTSIPFSSMLIKSAMKNMVIENSGTNVLLQWIISVIVAAVVVLFAYLSTGKIKKFTPMDAIRSGNNGERFKKKNLFKLGGKRIKATSFMAVNDVLCELRKYLVLLFASILGVWLVDVMVNTVNTLSSEKIMAWFAVTDSDAVIMEEEEYTSVLAQGTQEALYEYMNDYKTVIEEGGIPVENVVLEVGWSGIKIRKGEKTTKSLTQQGFGSDTEDYFYDKGTAPKYENELAITHVVAEQIDAGVGDTVYLDVNGEEKSFIVTAIYQSMNNMGEGIRITDKVNMDYKSVSLVYGIQVCFEGEMDEAARDKTIDKLKDILPDSKIMNMKEYVDNMLGGIAGRLESVKILMLAIVLIINILIVVLMQKMFLLRERGEMGMLKSIGFSNGDIVKWQTKRIMLVLFFGILIGTLTGTQFSQLTSGQVFKYMGASKITFQINALEVYLIYPVAIFVVSVLVCMLTMLNVRKITSQDMENID